MRVVELFSGIGSQRMALTLSGIPHEVVGISEINPHALDAYEAIWGDCPNLGDIKEVENLPSCDLVTYSFPCVDLSNAGKRAGMGEGTRSGLVWEVIRLLENAETDRPEWLLMENVPQVLTAPEWPVLLSRLSALGYRHEYGKLDSSRFGSAQKRVRAFMVSRLGQEPPKLPTDFANAPKLCLRDVMSESRQEKFIRRIPLERIRWRDSQNGMIPTVALETGRQEKSCTIKVIGDTDESFDQQARIYSEESLSSTIMDLGRRGIGFLKIADPGDSLKVIGDDTAVKYVRDSRIFSEDSMCPTILDMGRNGNKCIKIADPEYGDLVNDVPRMEEGQVCPTLDPTCKNKHFEGPRYRNPNDPAFTLTASGKFGGTTINGDDLVINLLTPLECWRLMGQPYWAYRRASRVCSESQLYNLAGNSIVVEVLEAIFRSMFQPWINPQRTLGEWIGKAEPEGEAGTGGVITIDNRRVGL